MEKQFQISEFIDKQLPQEILEQLKVADRVKFFLKQTNTSAFSQSENKPEIQIGDDGSPSSGLDTLRQVEDNISGLIDNVKDFEDQIEQLEDLVDEHLKDMAIPSTNDTVAKAVNQLGGTNGIITKEVMDTAQTILDYFPLMSMGQDPVLAALIGDGTLSGPYSKCNEITPDIGKKITLSKQDIHTVESTIKDHASKENETHDKKMKDMTIDILLTLWWKKLWPMFVVDMSILNPIRAIIYPVDSFIGFFQKTKFRRKSAQWIKDNGPLNKIINRLRNVLMCDIPPINYKPDVIEFNLNCKNSDNETCSEKNPIKQQTEGSPRDNLKTGNLGGMDVIIDDLGDGPCIDLNDLKKNMNSSKPSTFGCSPECVEAARLVMDRILEDALTPPETRI